MDGVNIKMNCSIFNYMPHLCKREHHFTVMKIYCCCIEIVESAQIISWKKSRGRGHVSK